jgi:hypothetical protein
VALCFASSSQSFMRRSLCLKRRRTAAWAARSAVAARCSGDSLLLLLVPPPALPIGPKDTVESEVSATELESPQASVLTVMDNDIAASLPNSR